MKQDTPLVRRFSTLEPYQEAYTLACSLETEGQGCWLTGALRVMMGSDHRLAIRKEILGPVAEEYGLTVAAVDSALRRLLETLDETGTQTWRDFRKEYGLERRKVTIGRLLYALESRLSQQ